MSKSIIPHRIVRREHIVGFSLGLGIVVGSSAWLACGSETFQGAQADAGQTVPSGCDLTVDPKDSPACIDDKLGLFVSSTTGDDAHPGTKSLPLKTISAAVAKADTQHNRVYICTGTYPESVKLTSTTSLFGGFSCTDWSYAGSDSSVVPKIVPTTPGFALDVENVNGPVSIEDLEADAPAAQNPGDSSIAVFVSSSIGAVTFRRVTAIAMDGAVGADAVSTSNFDGGLADLKGNSGSGDNGGAQRDCSPACANGVGSLGGKGGDANMSGQAGGPAGLPPLPPGNDGAGGVAGSSCSAHRGATRGAADSGAPGAIAAGNVSAIGWSASTGASGETGLPAQGGGGGQGQSAGSDCGGGGGGCGGCGGSGGAGGGSGGSSFAVLVYSSVVSFDTCTLQAGAGGAAKQGGRGQAGESPDPLSAGAPAGFVGCPGALGGQGGGGAGGGGGCGGNAIALGFSGQAPGTTNMTFTEGSAGMGGAGGAGANDNDGNAAGAGIKADIQELP